LPFLKMLKSRKFSLSPFSSISTVNLSLWWNEFKFIEQTIEMAQGYCKDNVIRIYKKMWI